MRGLIVTLTFSFAALTACGPVPQGRAPSQPAMQKIDVPVVVDANVEKLISDDAKICSDLKTNFAAESKTEDMPAQTYKIERVYQRVIRKDCDGKTLSNEIETITPPHVALHFQAPSQRAFQSVFVFNEATCADSLTNMPLQDIPLFGSLVPVTGDGVKSVDIKGDMANALFTFQVNKGLNRIFVRYFYSCRPDAKDEVTNPKLFDNKTCMNSGEQMTVEYPVNIQYSEKTLPGIWMIKPDSKDCKKTN